MSMGGYERERRGEGIVDVLLTWGCWRPFSHFPGDAGPKQELG
jgi:hypothetical protein